MRRMQGNLVAAAILIVSSATSWGSNPRTPLLNAFPACDQQAIEIMAPLSSQEAMFVAERATHEVTEIRFRMKGIQHFRANPNLLPGSSNYELATKQNEEHERQLTTRLPKCEQIMSKYARGERATRVAGTAVGRLDLELLQSLINNGAVLEAAPASKGKVDNPNSVWKNLLHISVFADPFLGWHGTTAIREEFIPVILSHVRHVNTREPESPFTDGNTILHSLAKSGTPSADYAIKYLIAKKNADPRIRNKAGRTPLDLYAGQDKEVMRLLAGAAPLAMPEADLPLSKVGPIETEARIASQGTALPKGTYPGFISSTLNGGEKINGTLRLGDQGEFEYLGNNGVALKGRFQLVGGNRIVGNGVSQLPKILGFSVFTYPDGSTSTTLKFNGKVSQETISGAFESPHETGTFAFILASQN